MRDLDKPNTPEKQSLKDKVLHTLNVFLKDEQHYVSNETYWRSVFAVACMHVNEKQQGAKHSFFDICKIVIEENMPPEKTMYKGVTYQNTKYPKKMVDEWNAWCAKQTTAPEYLTEDTIRFDIFTVAYAYIVDEKENNLPKGYLLD